MEAETTSSPNLTPSSELLSEKLDLGENVPGLWDQTEKVMETKDVNKSKHEHICCTVRPHLSLICLKATRCLTWLLGKCTQLRPDILLWEGEQKALKHLEKQNIRERKGHGEKEHIHVSKIIHIPISYMWPMYLVISSNLHHLSSWKGQTFYEYDLRERISAKKLGQ